MKIKVFYPNEKGNIELTKEKLEGLLNEVYNEGYRDGRNNNGYYYGITATPYVSSTRDSDIAYLSSTTPSLSVNATEITRSKVASSATIDCYDKAVSAIDCCINANDGITTDILEGKVKNAIMVEYAEAANEA